MSDKKPNEELTALYNALNAHVTGEHVLPQEELNEKLLLVDGFDLETLTPEEEQQWNKISLLFLDQALTQAHESVKCINESIEDLIDKIDESQMPYAQDTNGPVH